MALPYHNVVDQLSELQSNSKSHAINQNTNNFTNCCHGIVRVLGNYFTRALPSHQASKKGHYLPVACSLLLATGSCHAAVLIDKNVNNGDFTSSVTESEISSVPGWTRIAGGTFVAGPGDSTRTDGPFGSPTSGTSLFLHNNVGTTIRSTATISLTNGDSLALAYDYTTPTIPATLLFDLYQGGTFVSTLYSTSTGSVVAGFQLKQTTIEFAGATGDYNIAIRYIPGNAASDVGFDRLYLATVPEPSGALLLSGGLALGLIRRKRRHA